MSGLFDDVIGHGAVTDLLQRELAAPSQAYLFVGPSSSGKATVARRFAGGLLCGDGDPGCLRRVSEGNHPDLAMIEPDGKTSLTVERARATVARAALSPVEGERKVFKERLRDTDQCFFQRKQTESILKGQTFAISNRCAAFKYGCVVREICVLVAGL